MVWLKVLNRWQQIGLASLLFFLLFYLNCLPAHPFNKPTATVLLDQRGELLAAKIAADQQWRFEPVTHIPAKVETCLLSFEDRQFYRHWGISLKGLARAFYQNIRHHKIISGGSTLTMQVVRLMRGNPPRTVFEKSLEMLLATRMEFRYSKKELLAMLKMDIVLTTAPRQIDDYSSYTTLLQLIQQLALNLKEFAFNIWLRITRGELVQIQREDRKSVV